MGCINSWSVLEHSVDFWEKEKGFLLYSSLIIVPEINDSYKVCEFDGSHYKYSDY